MGKMVHASSKWIVRQLTVFLFCLHSITANFYYPEIAISDSDVMYSELESLNVTCAPNDNCQEDRIDDDLILYNCHCGSICSQFDTCCLDSKFRNTAIHSEVANIKCLTVYGKNPVDVFMVDTCKSCQTTNGLAEDLCLRDGEAANDPFLLIPVTSPVTRITYKNYFCFTCNEKVETVQPIYWNFQLSGVSECLSQPSVPTLNFNETLRSWTVQNETQNDVPQPVSVSLLYPEEAQNNITRCHKNIISECSKEWTDVTVIRKCDSYMARVLIYGENGTERYKNPHCAICNFKDVSKVYCFEAGGFSVASVGVGDTLFVGLFSLEDKTNRCSKNMVYDKFAKKCRKVL